MPQHPRILTWFTSLVAAYHFIVVAQIPTWFGLFLPENLHKSVSILSALILIFLLIPIGGQRHGEDTEAAGRFRRLPWYDVLLLLAAIVGAGYIIVDFETIESYGEFGKLTDTKGLVLSLALTLPLLEAVRRTTGWVLLVIILSFVALVLFQPYLPGLLFGQGYPVEKMLYSAYISEGGIFGLPLGIAANIVIVFLTFGALMEAAGASRWFMDMALALTGWSRGGPAKAAVLASAMFGSISGSPSGNSATTGVFTIPMMKEIGYTPAFAAAVEAVASTGGIILPPVMGALAFLMAEWIEVSYAEIVIAAAAPAALYFLIVFVSVHLQARKDGIRALPRGDLPEFWPAFKRGWYYLIPMGALVYFLLIERYSPGTAGIYTCAFVIATSFLSPDRRFWLTPARIIVAFDQGVRRWVTVAAITASVGIMIGALELSGVGIKFSRFIVELSGGDLTTTLLLVGIVSLIVGMGLDATPAYVTLATLMAPALIRLGVPDMAAHLYVIYWGLASFYTPPTCIAVFVTSAIAQSKVWPTGWEAMRIGIAAFLIPFAFVFNPGLMMRGEVFDVVIAIVTAVIGATLLAAGIRGFAFSLLNPVQRVALMGGGLLLIAPGYKLPLIGLALGLAAAVPGLRKAVRAGTT